MTKQQFNREIAERVMGWTTYPDDDDPFNIGEYRYDTPDGLLVEGPDFTTDHNAAAMLRERIDDLNKTFDFVRALTWDTDAWCRKRFPVIASYKRTFNMLSATPAQTACAAYRAVTGEELEAVDE
jgi:hypothetical protein